MRSSIAPLVVLVFAICGCSRPIKRARTTEAEPASEEEIAAAQRIRNRSCPAALGFLLPGVGQLCTGKTAQGAALLAAAAAQGGAAIVASTQVEVAESESVLAHPAVFIPLAGLQDVYVYAVSSTYIDSSLAQRKRFVPRDSLADLLAAPFNLEVMAEPKVFLGLAGALAVGIGATFLIDEIDTSNAGGDPNVFGRRFSAAPGYGLGLGVGAGLFTQVGIAEESLFRGVVQSGIARGLGETSGLFYGSLIFGAAHAPNALALEGEQRTNYLIYALPTITALGTYMSYLYKDSDYSLAPSTALHFWYDFLLSGTFFILSPDDSLLSAQVKYVF